MHRPTIIAIDGMDGAGKTTQFEILHKMLCGRGHRVLTASFPAYEDFFGIEIGRMLSGKAESRADKLDAKSMALWFACDRLKWYNSVELEAYDYVLLNRYSLSNAVYQSARTDSAQRGDFICWVTELEHKVFGLPEPDLYFIFDVSPDVSKDNVQKKGHRDYVGDSADVYESSESLMTKVRGMYLELSDTRQDVCVISTVKSGMMLPADEIHNTVVSELITRGLI